MNSIVILLLLAALIIGAIVGERYVRTEKREESLSADDFEIVEL